MISSELFSELGLPYKIRNVEAIHKEGGLVKLHIFGNSKPLIPAMIQSGADVFKVNLLDKFGYSSNFYGKEIKAFIGNPDPVGNLLQKSSIDCRNKARSCIEIAQGKKYFLSAGCEVPAEVSDEVFKASWESVCDLALVYCYCTINYTT